MNLAQGSPLLRFGCVAALVGFDQWSKRVVFAWLGVDPHAPVHGERELFGTTWLSFANSCNGGAAFGQLDQIPWILVVGRVAAVLFLSWLLLCAAPRPRLVLWAMALVLAGALGNVIDNLGAGCTVFTRPDHPFLGVRDFVLVNFAPIGIDWDFPAFNVADACITVGACAWILSGLLHPDRPRAEPAA
jgi:signal peptidase II